MSEHDDELDKDNQGEDAKVLPPAEAEQPLDEPDKNNKQTDDAEALPPVGPGQPPTGNTAGQPPRRRFQFWLGIALGSIPLLIWLGTGCMYMLSQTSTYSIGLNGLFLGATAFVILLILSIIYLVVAQYRFLGYGLLIALMASPIIAYIACTAGNFLLHA